MAAKTKPQGLSGDERDILEMIRTGAECIYTGLRELEGGENMPAPELKIARDALATISAVFASSTDPKMAEGLKSLSVDMGHIESKTCP